jgi:hypothetical protein
MFKKISKFLINRKKEKQKYKFFGDKRIVDTMPEKGVEKVIISGNSLEMAIENCNRSNEESLNKNRYKIVDI